MEEVKSESVEEKKLVTPEKHVEEPAQDPPKEATPEKPNEDPV